MADTVTVNNGSYFVPETGDTGWGDYTNQLLQALAGNTGVDYTKAVFIGQGGNDSNSGYSPFKSTCAKCKTRGTS